MVQHHIYKGIEYDLIFSDRIYMNVFKYNKIFSNEEDMIRFINKIILREKKLLRLKLI